MSRNPTVVWIIPQHPQREAMAYTIRLLGSIHGISTRCVDVSNGASAGDFTVHYGCPPVSGHSGSVVSYDESFWSRAITGIDITPTSSVRWRGTTFPTWRHSSATQRSDEGSSRACPVDPIAAAFFLVSRMEELRGGVLDRHGRFSEDGSWMVRMGLIERPLVHEYADALWASIAGDASQHNFNPWPNGHAFAIAFTHDVDRMRMHGSLWRELRSGVGGLRFRGGIAAAARRLQSLARTRLFKGQDPYATIDDILAGHRSNRISSTWFWIAAKPSIRNADYHPRDPAVRDLISSIRLAGHEIGLHGSYESFDRPELLPEEKLLLESVASMPITSTRQHYLRFHVGETWRAHQNAGLRCDTTLGFAGRVGYRAGLAVPYQPWDFEHGRPHDIWEVPLLMMDVTLREYMGLTPTEACQASQRMLDALKQIRGGAAVLWHNSSLNEVDWVGWNDVYETWLRIARESDAWCATVSDMVECRRAIQARLNGG